MCTISTKSYTPENIGDAIRFRIPLYQRPYAWEEPQVKQLLVDLKLQFYKDEDKNEKYYIGILSVGKTNEDENLYDLIDGQQRITTLILIGRYFLKKYPNSQWSAFLEKRMELYGREEDQKYLTNLDSVSTPNPKMVSAIKVIEEFVKSLEEIDGLSEAELFSNYIFENAAFFISEVPADYSIIEKNLQFVRMNNRGKQLELNDILKIKLADTLPEKSENGNQITKSKFVIEWNRFSQMGCSPDNLDNENKKTLKDILTEPKTEDSQKVLKDESEIFYQSIVSYPEFLLIALSRFNYGDAQEPEYFKVSHRKDKLLDEFGFGEFKFDWNENQVINFYELLKNQYEILNRFFIKRDKDEAYKFRNFGKKGEKEEVNDYFKSNEGGQIDKLKIFQSYLYVSKEPHSWLKDAFSFFEPQKVPDEIEADKFLSFLKDKDNEGRNGKYNDKLELCYNKIDRYWFWRLDYYLWEKRKELFKEDYLKVVEKYTFKSNRSIEHLHAQSAINKWSEKEEGEILNSFGNLAMISPGFNSSQSNNVENVKFQRIVNQIKSKNLLESIKMLLMYQKAPNWLWTPELAIEHGNEMIDVLISSFPKVGYDDIRKRLEEQKSKLLNNN